MERIQSVPVEAARHPFRRTRPLPDLEPAGQARSMQEDLAFFLVSFASAFIILYGFVL